MKSYFVDRSIPFGERALRTYISVFCVILTAVLVVFCPFLLAVDALIRGKSTSGLLDALLWVCAHSWWVVLMAVVVSFGLLLYNQIFVTAAKVIGTSQGPLLSNPVPPHKARMLKILAPIAGWCVLGGSIIAVIAFTQLQTATQAALLAAWAGCMIIIAVAVWYFPRNWFTADTD